MTTDERKPDQVEEMERIEDDVAPGREPGDQAPPTDESAED
jgi:hypothetical protein